MAENKELRLWSQERSESHVQGLHVSVILLISHAYKSSQSEQIGDFYEDIYRGMTEMAELLRLYIQVYLFEFEY